MPSIDPAADPEMHDLRSFCESEHAAGQSEQTLRIPEHQQHPEKSSKLSPMKKYAQIDLRSKMLCHQMPTMDGYMVVPPIF